MNGEVNCILAVCCPEGSDNQRAALAREMVKGTGCEPGEAATMAAWVIENFDLAPKGSLQPFKNEIARLAREGHTKQ